MQLMRILSNTGGLSAKTSNNQNEEVKGINMDNRMAAGEEDQDMADEEQSRTYDEFAEIQFQTEWVQKLWDVTGHLWYHEESQAFLYPVTAEDLGGK